MFRGSVGINEVGRNRPGLDVDMQRPTRGQVRDERDGSGIARGVNGDTLIPWAIRGKRPPSWSVGPGERKERQNEEKATYKHKSGVGAFGKSGTRTGAAQTV